MKHYGLRGIRLLNFSQLSGKVLLASSWVAVTGLGFQVKGFGWDTREMPALVNGYLLCWGTSTTHEAPSWGLGTSTGDKSLNSNKGFRFTPWGCLGLSS